MPISKESLNNCFKGKNVLITGISGFKGSWLSIWLLNLEQMFMASL